MKLISSISFLIISILLFFFVANPIYGEVKQIKIDISTYDEALNNSNKLQEIRDSLVNAYKRIKQEDKDRLDHFLPSSIDNIELILEIEKIANLHGMPVKDIKFEKDTESINATDDKNNVSAPNDPTANLPYGVFPIQFTVEGKYDTFISFLEDLEHNLRLVDVDSLSFNVSKQTTDSLDKTSSNIYSYLLKVNIYWLK